ncbi:hypothetical protein AGABI2DRAFT_194977 [Agaricus bisporus var. bisporus H97]|uniref:hypothetical protein n=1 Tax=Agaricus bisporus var. bisporus (strain H97 / ATCC MYA-4626 / FGSC 10389) TaxID=936046 RepID=UPI00029F57DC|nr:hypothetical protein AGABI2DRAFT_194977 [Agaricus bisporus var. bisporus H97]EKV44177.1 hypothetical protein AGABI2DRAFT_194977 [Agaricus bisporus var. bisporus H97]
MSTDTVSLKIEFSGGLELLFANQRSHRISIPAIVPKDDGDVETKSADITYLIHYLRHNLLKERPELFTEDKTVRPGILVLVNDTDWELEGEGDYVLKDGDEIVFISTLHGG